MKKRVLSFYLHSENVFVLKVKRQLQKTPTPIDGEMNGVLFSCSAGVQTPAERIMEGSLSARSPERKVP
jgi:hypothetical protein